MLLLTLNELLLVLELWRHTLKISFVNFHWCLFQQWIDMVTLSLMTQLVH